MSDEIIIDADDLMKIYEAELLRRYEAQATMSDDLIKALQKELRQADDRIAELEAALRPYAPAAVTITGGIPQTGNHDTWREACRALGVDKDD